MQEIVLLLSALAAILGWKDIRDEVKGLRKDVRDMAVKCAANTAAGRC